MNRSCHKYSNQKLSKPIMNSECKMLQLYDGVACLNTLCHHVLVFPLLLYNLNIKYSLGWCIYRYTLYIYQKVFFFFLQPSFRVWGSFSKQRIFICCINYIFLDRRICLFFFIYYIFFMLCFWKIIQCFTLKI